MLAVVFACSLGTHRVIEISDAVDSVRRVKCFRCLKVDVVKKMSCEQARGGEKLTCALVD